MYIHRYEANQDRSQEGGTTMLEFGIHHCQYMTFQCANCCDKLRVSQVASKRHGIASDPPQRNNKTPLR